MCINRIPLSFLLESHTISPSANDVADESLVNCVLKIKISPKNNVLNVIFLFDGNFLICSDKILLSKACVCVYNIQLWMHGTSATAMTTVEYQIEIDRHREWVNNTVYWLLNIYNSSNICFFVFLSNVLILDQNEVRFPSLVDFPVIFCYSCRIIFSND